ncbi:wiskott-Aldrich syndrome protein homolog 1-like isoform X4 [Panicum virgatum]|uniref:wiskott-Aldrich syndrome protein homolog 1-like isoform X4 n=1 Tax=Panicum virgatum TaxID=38727 RepID=UPI0019D55974|nr:wiskott-Aldrich syndrome protein homolog 1-like isoform X4 [Panicum virgatum]XP_039855606.1 wiskott-Aldrich syndrome protein homolog 1-like isoform X4 [Panicum virgatum]
MESPPSAPASDGFPSPPSAPSPAITLSSIPIHFFGHQRSRTPPLSLAGRAHSPPPLPPLASDDGAACVARRGRGSRPAQPGRGARSPAVSARQPRLLAGGEWAPDGLPPRSRTSAAHPRALLPSSPAEGEAPPPVPTPRTSTASFPFSSAQTEGEGREHAQELGGLLRLGTFCRNSSPTAKSAPPAVHSGGKVELKRRGSLHWTNSNAEQMEVGLPNLVPQLRPYQLRAAHWMVQREKGNILHHEYVNSTPYCVPIDFIHENSRMFYIPFNGNISLRQEPSQPYVSGGILAGTMQRHVYEARSVRTGEAWLAKR